MNRVGGLYGHQPASAKGLTTLVHIENLDKSYYTCSYRELGVRPIAIFSNCKSFNCNANSRGFSHIRHSSSITIKFIRCEMREITIYHVCHD